ncbi:hypothetical protein GCK72_009073 [Caenorhabditis remanei]|uniref:Uncharacterized protein n=1 Tax=Caenorhabditis remanei TaxID=31234 RepID=A0A6A5H2J8_CAERE|nr:hypothetical protein GCK72_009073 [Caenorhabditis remanei]KAF1760823.1 hypothetical protein GCK72_009073 [Caenorhabditis remanei]
MPSVTKSHGKFDDMVVNFPYLSTMEEIEQLEVDLIDFITYHYICTDKLPLLPSSLFSTMKDIGKKLATDMDEEVVDRMFSLDTVDLLEDDCLIRMLKRCFNIS